MRLYWQIYLGVTAMMSAATFTAYALDKRAAIKGSRRIPESTLHLLAALGGWPGAALGARLTHHKARKVKFRVIRSTIILLHLALAMWLYLSF